jgi:hypothetical protein
LPRVDVAAGSRQRGHVGFDLAVPGTDVAGHPPPLPRMLPPRSNIAPVAQDDWVRDTGR